MKYVGSKAKHAKHILPIILERRFLDQWYIEPFAGGFNTILKVDGRRVANDIDPYVTALFRAVLAGWTPPENVSEAEYEFVRKNKDDIHDHLVGFIGYQCSFGAKFFGGYARGNDKDGKPRNYAAESRRNILKQIAKEDSGSLIITTGDYKRTWFPVNEQAIVYCDPPYQGTQGYGYDFDHVEFWNWCTELGDKGHQVFVSEYEIPSKHAGRFEVVWHRNVNSSLHFDRKEGQKRSVEKLYKFIGWNRE